MSATTAARYKDTDRWENPQPIASHSSSPFCPAFSAVASISDQYSTWSTPGPDHNIHPLHFAVLTKAVEPECLEVQRGLRSSMPHHGQTDGDSVMVWVSGLDSLSGSALWLLIWRKLLPCSAFSPPSFIYTALFLSCSCCSPWANGQHIDHASRTSKLRLTTKTGPPCSVSGKQQSFSTVICEYYDALFLLKWCGKGLASAARFKSANEGYEA